MASRTRAMDKSDTPGESESESSSDHEVHVNAAIDIPEENDTNGSGSQGDGSNNGSGGNDRPAKPSLISLRTIQLVELSLENITYAPTTRSATAAVKGAKSLFNKQSPSDSNSNNNNNPSHSKREYMNASTNSVSTPSSSLVTKKRTTILSNVSTTIAPFQLSAWMGPSGCGKTSLVSVAAGLISDPANDLIGDSTIKINGEVGSSPPKRLVGVVWQDDLLLSNLTVKETVRFAARLKTPKTVCDDEVEMLVDTTLSKLGLTHVQDSLIGVPGGSGKSRGISGGERKRVAVAVEMVASPSILLLDEPTSGLDATTALQLMQTLKKLCQLGHSIAVVIHQPRTSIFNMFDNLLMLSQGKVVYEGEPAGAREFLESCPGVDGLPPETGKADWIMDVINEDEQKEGGGMLPKLWEEYRTKRQLEEGDSNNIPQSTLTSDNQLRQRNNHSIDMSKKSTQSKRPARRLSTIQELEENEPKFQSSFWTQLKLLTSRTSKQQRGQRLTRVAALLTFSWTAFTCLAWGRLPDTTTYIYSRASLLFFLIIAQSNSVVNTSLVIFSTERRLLSRERAKKLYGVLPYFMALTLADMVNSALLPTLYGIIVYWICNLRPTASAFFTFVLAYYLTLSAAQSTGLFLGVLIKNTRVALMLAPLLTICLMIIGGFYMPLDLIHPALRYEYFSYLSLYSIWNMLPSTNAQHYFYFSCYHAIDGPHIYPWRGMDSLRLSLLSLVVDPSHVVMTTLMKAQSMAYAPWQDQT